MTNPESIEQAYPMRHRDRLMPTDEARALLERARYGVLSTTDAQMRTYTTPVNHCVIDDHICFHVANKGRKIDNFATTREAAFCVVDQVQIHRYTSTFESVIAEGPIDEALGEDKRAILAALIEKYSPAHGGQQGAEHIARYTAACRTFRVRIARIAGKRKTISA